MADLYRVLQVDPAADAEVVEAAYHRLARKFHPDVSARPDADERIRDLNAAYEVLGDPTRRAAYDATRIPRDSARATPPRSTPARGTTPPPRRTPVRVVTPRRETRAPSPGAGAPAAALPRAGGWEVAPGGSGERRTRHIRRPILAATMAGLAASVAVAALSAQLFSAAVTPPVDAAVNAIVIVSSASEAPAPPPAPAARATPTAVVWPPPLAPTTEQAAPHPDLFSRFVGAARQATRRLQGPTPPEPPYNPVLP